KEVGAKSSEWILRCQILHIFLGGGMIVQFDETGRIYSVISVYTPSLPEMMRKRGQDFIQLEKSPDFDVTSEGYVDIQRGALERRPVLPIESSGHRIAANGKD